MKKVKTTENGNRLRFLKGISLINSAQALYHSLLFYHCNDLYGRLKYIAVLP
jgi:hypothetical protein